MCLDSDEAGVMAIERICASEILLSVTERYAVDFRVASLPKGVKDPAEFVEGRNDKEAGDEFRKEVILEALEWSDWYIQRIVSTYDPEAVRGGKGSGGSVARRSACGDGGLVQQPGRGGGALR